MTASLGPTQTGHTAFKKRVLRPWKPALLSENTRPAEIHTELLQKQLETSLETKNKQQEALQAQLTLLEGSRMTVGGFFQPSSLFATQSKEVLQKTQDILEELEKEREILTITHQLQLTQAQEETRRAQLEWQAEATARQSAETNALTALQQAQEAFERVKQVEDKICQVSHIKTQLEQTVFELEEKLRVNHENQAAALQAVERHLAAEREGKKIESTLRKHLQNELTLSEQRLHTLEQQLDEKSNEVSAILQKLDNEQQARANEAVLSEQRLHTLEQQLDEKSNEVSTILQRLYNEQQVRSHEVEQRKHIQQELQASTEKVVMLHEEVEQMLSVQQQQLQEQANLKETLLALQQQTNKLNSIIENEQALRKLVEKQVQKMAVQRSGLEMRLKTEEHARQAAETKNRQIVKQVIQAVLQAMEAANKQLVKRVIRSVLRVLETA